MNTNFQGTSDRVDTVLSDGANKAETPRTRLLMEANAIVNKDRNMDYGNPEDNFKQIADLWSAYKQFPFTMMDVAMMCGLIKFARIAKNPRHHDSLVDIAGYAACAADIQAFLNRTGTATASEKGR